MHTREIAEKCDKSCNRGRMLKRTLPLFPVSSFQTGDGKRALYGFVCPGKESLQGKNRGIYRDSDGMLYVK